MSSRAARQIDNLMDVLIEHVKKKLKGISNKSARVLVKILLNKFDLQEISLKMIGAESPSFIKKNSAYIDERVSGEVVERYLRSELINILREELFKILEEKEHDTFKLKDEDKEEVDYDKALMDKVQAINDKDVYYIKKLVTFDDIRKRVDEEGKNIEFKYDFSNPDLKKSYIRNIPTLQLVDVHINDSGQSFEYPLKFTYVCSECGEKTVMPEYEVASQKYKIKCPGKIEVTTPKGEIREKRCNNILSPDDIQTETMDSYIYSITYTDENGNIKRAEAISFKKLPTGPLTVVLLKIPRSFSTEFVFIVDYNIPKRKPYVLPKRKPGEHYIFTLIESIDKHIIDYAGYYHYGYLPVKIAMLIQYMARYNKYFKNVFHISLSGNRSTGKSQFARYWGIMLYSDRSWLSNATSISIPKLRGTMETYKLFNKDYRYQYKGLLGEVDLIVIDEVKESPDVKNNLKQYALESNYEYSKQGGNNLSFRRTAQLIVTQNIDTNHLKRYAKDVEKVYVDMDVIKDGDIEIPKPKFRPDMDLTLPLYMYKNDYLREAIKKVRDQYERDQINWIDGSELALKQRFYFYFFFSNDGISEKLSEVIKENMMRDVVSDNTELMRLFNTERLRKYVEDLEKIYSAENEKEYFYIVDVLLIFFDKPQDARTQEMSYMVLRAIRMWDNRKLYKDIDLEIFQYILENIDDKVSINDITEFKLRNKIDYNYIRELLKKYKNNVNKVAKELKEKYVKTFSYEVSSVEETWEVEGLDDALE